MALRWGILSTANITDKLLDSGTDQEFVAVGSRDGARAEAYAREKGIARAHGSYEALLADPDVDAIYNPLPNALHVEWSIRALEAGKHVLCEKPLSRRPEDVDRVFDVAQREGRVLAEAFMWRHHPQVARARELLDGGAIGDVRVLRAHFAFKAADPDDIRLQRALDGGGLMDVGTYCVSGCRTLAGAEPERAYAELVSGGHGVDVSLAATLRFPGDVLAHLDCGLSYPGGSLLAAAGTEGSFALADPWHGNDAVIELRRADGSVERIEAGPANSYALELADFEAAARPRRRTRPGPHHRGPLHLRRKERPMPDRLKTSLGIWALGGMITRFVPVGYQPEHGSESTADKVRRAVDGLGDLMDDYEFHYPYELSRDNLDEVREALDGHGIYCLASGLHLDPRNGKGGLSSPDDAIRDEALRVTLDACEFAGEIGAHFIIWPGIEGYNYPFQTPYRESWARFIDGVGQAATALAGHGKKLFLEHKNSEPAMKIFMRNIGMTLHVIHKLRAQGIDNVQVNMDWQHLLMNGEHLPEYAALLDAEGLLGHQHANSGWGIFDDDNMVGATAFMETVELAIELRRADYGANGERLGFDLYPYTEDQVAAVKRSVEQWHFIDEVGQRIDGDALREAQQRKDAVAAYELVYAALGAPAPSRV